MSVSASTRGSRQTPILFVAQEVLEKLRCDILDGALDPDAKLPFAMLQARYGVGIGTVREALSHLGFGGAGPPGRGPWVSGGAGLTRGPDRYFGVTGRLRAASVTGRNQAWRRAMGSRDRVQLPLAGQGGGAATERARGIERAVDATASRLPHSAGRRLPFALAAAVPQLTVRPSGTLPAAVAASPAKGQQPQERVIF